MHSRDVNWLQISEILSAKADECRRRNSDDAMGISMETDAARWLAASKICTTGIGFRNLSIRPGSLVVEIVGHHGQH